MCYSNWSLSGVETSIRKIMSDLDSNYWNDRYLNNQFGWDIGSPSTPLKEYIDQLKDKDIKILIPGCGNSHEGEYLFNQGFSNIYLLDFAEESKTNFLKRCPEFPADHFLVGDFFELNDTFDLILEQTFFCALNPELRDAYAQKMKTLLNSNGKLVGLFFTFPDQTDGPPFGGDTDEYTTLFEKHFDSISMELCYNSIEPRKGSEVFVELRN